MDIDSKPTAINWPGWGLYWMAMFLFGCAIGLVSKAKRMLRG